ncbi:MAG: FxLYD domain-containing protein [Bacteroidota bacterium]
MKQAVTFAAMLALLVAGCTAGGGGDLVVVSKTLQKQTHTVGSEFGAMGTSVESLFWIEGRLKNGDQEEKKNVVIRFKCTDGTSTHILVAQVPKVAPGATVQFKTRRFRTPADIQMLDEEPEIYTD